MTTSPPPLSDATDPTGGDLRRRLIAARSLSELGGRRLPADRVAELRTVLDRARGRLAVAGDHTVVVLAGPTGVGKSSLFNALLDVDLATVGVTRPTTSEPLAGVVSADPVAELMGHLGLVTWHHVAVHAHPEMDSLVLVDLPDHDSVVTSHRERAADLVAVADRLVWVVDPEKYADSSVHDDLLAPLQAHAGVLTVVCNRIDRIGDDHAEVVADLRRLLADDGLAGAEVLATSTTTGQGIVQLRDLLVASVADHRAAGNRIVADLRALAVELAPFLPPDAGAEGSRKRHDDVVEAAMQAAGVPAVLDAVADTHRHRARRATGWPPLRRFQSPGRDPLARLGLGRTRTGGEVGSRSSRQVPHGVATATLATAVRARLDAVTDGWPGRWAEPLEHRLDEVVADLPVHLDRAVAGTDLGDDHHSAWWTVVGAMQWVLTAAMAVGLGWLLAALVVAWLQLPDLPMPTVAGSVLPWPTVLALGGAVLGLVVGALAMLPARAGAARARRRVRQRLQDRVRAVVEDGIVDVIEAEGARAATARDHLGRMGR